MLEEITDISRYMHRLFSVLAGYSLSMFIVLRAVKVANEDGAPAKQKDIVNNGRIDRSTTCEILERLRLEGSVERIGNAAEDRRVSLFRITDTGKEKLNKGETVYKSIDRLIRETAAEKLFLVGISSVIKEMKISLGKANFHQRDEK